MEVPYMEYTIRIFAELPEDESSEEYAEASDKMEDVGHYVESGLNCYADQVREKLRGVPNVSSFRVEVSD